MKIVFRLAKPKTEKERMFHVETPVDEGKTPGEAWVVLEGKEYLIEVQY